MQEITIAAVLHHIIALRLPARCADNVTVMGDATVVVARDGTQELMEMGTNESTVAVAQAQVLAAGVVARGVGNFVYYLRNR